MKRWLPSPPLSIALFAFWLLLDHPFDAAALLMGAALALVVPLLTRSLRPTPARMRRPLLVLKLTGVVAIDVARSAMDVSRLLLTRRTAAIASRFVQVPLELRDANALAVLAMALCLTPGTAWAELSLDRRTLRVHVFDLPDEAAFITQVKTRYERLLMEIFET